MNRNCRTDLESPLNEKIPHRLFVDKWALLAMVNSNDDGVMLLATEFQGTFGSGDPRDEIDASLLAGSSFSFVRPSIR